MSALVASIAGKVLPSLIGGLFGRKKQTNEVDYVKMRDNAIAAGFNPLTALRNGGAAGFTSVTPALSSNNFIKDALSGGFSAFESHKRSHIDKEREQLELGIMREELKQMQARGRIYSQPNYGFTPPRVNQYSGQHEDTSSSSGISTDMGRASDSDVTDYVVGGTKVDVDRGMSDAEKIETRYADGVSNIYGFGVLARDWMKNSHWAKTNFKVKMTDMPGDENLRPRKSRRPRTRPPALSPYISSTLTSAF